jgi:hypothetical protein
MNGQTPAPAPGIKAKPKRQPNNCGRREKPGKTAPTGKTKQFDGGPRIFRRFNPNKNVFFANEPGLNCAALRVLSCPIQDDRDADQPNRDEPVFPLAEDESVQVCAQNKNLGRTVAERKMVWDEPGNFRDERETDTFGTRKTSESSESMSISSTIVQYTIVARFPGLGEGFSTSL